jgi:glutamyl-tRNA reductase
MSLLVVGVSHHSAPIAMLERVALPDVDAAKLLDDVGHHPTMGGAMVLATCNRVEVYAEATRFHAALAEISALVAQHADVSIAEITPHLYVHYDQRAVQHVFAVACGLDSMVIGETQVLGQMRRSLRAAQDAGVAGREVNEVVQQALRVGKRAHAETSIDRIGVSVAAHGLDLLGDAVGGLAGRTVVVVGAGATGSLVANDLVGRGVKRLVIVNRSDERGQALVSALRERAEVEAIAIETQPMQALRDSLAVADAVVTCTGALGYLVTAEDIPSHRPFAALDLAMPRDIDPAVADAAGITVIDMDHIAGVDTDTADVTRVREIVADEVSAFLAGQRADLVTPTVAALRARADEVVRLELERLDSRLPDLPDAEREEVARGVRRVVDKLLHQPTVRVKELAADTGNESYAEALRILFDLDPQTVESVALPDEPGGAR